MDPSDHLRDEDDEDDEDAQEQFEAFEAAAAFLAGAVASNNKLFTDAIKLQFYGLYKQTTTGPCNISKPGMFNRAGRAKWDAWNKSGSMEKSAAAEAYTTLLDSIVPDWYESSDGGKKAQQGGGFGGPVFSAPTQALGEESDKEEDGDEETSPIHRLAGQGNVEEVVKLLDSGVSVDVVDECGCTPLHFAADRGSLEVAKLLISRGALIDARDDDGQSPLHYAALCEHLESSAPVAMHMPIKSVDYVNLSSELGSRGRKLSALKPASMFKLPQLQPQLTGNNGVERSKSASTYNPFSSSSTRRYAPPGGEEAQVIANSAFEVKGWESLAKEITHDVTQSDKYKSIALHAEVKLAEALEKSARVCPTTHAPGGEERPNKLKTAVCCQLLGEFAGLCGPFSSVLKNIRDELLKSTYSWYYVSERGALVFDQLPWFTVAERLEREKEVMAIEREQFKSALQEQQDAIMRIEEQVVDYQWAMNSIHVPHPDAIMRIEEQVGTYQRAKDAIMRIEEQDAIMRIEEQEVNYQQATNPIHDAIMRIEEQVGTYQRAMVAAREETESMKRHLESLTSSEELARIEAKTGREELKRARKDWMKMRDELASEKEAHAQLKVASDQNMTYMSKQVSSAKKAAEAAHCETRDMQHTLN
eukprot:gene26371-17465_t